MSSWQSYNYHTSDGRNCSDQCHNISNVPKFNGAQRYFSTHDTDNEPCWKPFYRPNITPPTRPCPCPHPCPLPCPPIPTPTPSYLEAYTAGANALNVISGTQTVRNLAFTTLASSTGTDILYSPTNPQAIILNAPGRYLILVKGVVDFSGITTSTGTLYTSIVQNGTVLDQVTHNIALAAGTQDAFSLQTITCTTTAGALVNVTATSSPLAAGESISYRDLRIIVIKLSSQGC